MSNEIPTKVEPFLIERLYRKYPMGPIVDGVPTMGWREFPPIPRINMEAALEIEALRKIKDAAEEWLHFLSTTGKGMYYDGIPGELMDTLDAYKDIQDSEYRG